MTTKKYIGFFTATSIVIANMIGTGVFTSLGFQVMDIHSVFALLTLWIVGGIVALCGALTYGELAAAMPRSGSEYYYLSKIYHPAVGFLSGWVSMTVGFAAPVAMSAMLLGGYASRVFPGLNETLLAVAVLAILTVIHSLSMKTGGKVQNVFTLLKVIFIVFIILAGLFSSSHQHISVLPDHLSFGEIFSSSFAVGLYWVSYSYSGWNASAYITGEVENPQVNVPRSLFRGTLFVMILYVLINFIFLFCAPMDKMAGQKEVGFVAANFIFGETGGRIIGIAIAVLLVSSVSSMIIAGPRVAQVMGEDVRIFRIFAKKNSNHVPYIAIIFQSIITLIMILTSSFENILVYIGFTLNIFLFLTVMGVFVLRYKNPDLPRPYKTWGYPVVPAIFLIVTAWIIYEGLTMKTKESLEGLATISCGLLVYFADRFISKEKNNS